MAATPTGGRGGLRRRSRLAMSSGRAMLASAIGLVAAAVALILIVGIVLVLLKANESNDLVAAIRDAASWLAGPFEGLFKFDRQRTETAVNWGVAAAVWFVAGRVLARIVAP